ncbi:MAG: MFS transporter [Pyrinomonadaceae bacterium]
MTYRQLLGANADFRRLWIGQVISEIGDWLNNIAVFALTLNLAGRGHEATAVSIYAIARHLPLFFFGPIAGVVVDRANRRRVMIAADVLRAALALGFLFANHFASLALIYVVAASLFAVSAFFNAAKRAAIPNVARADELLTANSLTASTTAATIAVGSGLGGIIATFIGRDVVFVLNAATFLVSALIISRIQGRTNAAREIVIADEARLEHQTFLLARRISFALRRMISDFRDGLRYVRRDGVLSAVFIVAAGWGLGNGVARALYSLFGARLGEQAASGYVARPTDFGISVLFVTMGLGGVLGAPFARRYINSSRASATKRDEVEILGSRMGRSMIFDGAGLALFTLMPNLWLASLVLIAREINFAIWWTAQQTILMRRTTDKFAGRVFASYETLTTLMMVTAMLISGTTADVYGFRIVAACGGVTIALAGVVWFLLKRRRNARFSDEIKAAEIPATKNVC